MRFPYFQLGPKDFAPIIPLQLFGKNGWLALEAYIDSGATYSIFNADRADILGIDYQKKGKKIYLTVGDGGLIEIYLCPIRVKVENDQWNMPIGFSKQLGVGFNLMGRRGFFDRFRVCFNDKDKFVDLTRL